MRPENTKTPDPKPEKPSVSGDSQVTKTPDAAGQGPGAAEPPPAEDDPTRFGDWQVRGRCIDF